MLDKEILFGSLTNLFILGWLALFIGGFMREPGKARKYLLIAGGRVIPLVLLAAFVVGWLLTRGMPGDIVSLEGVLLGYTVPGKVLSAWFEILGLALLVSRWMVDDAAANGIPAPVLSVGLVGSFFAAAIGLLVYLLLSASWVRFATPRRSGESG